MLMRVSLAILLSIAAQSAVFAQTMRFDTSVGSFDMVLNPNNDPNLQPLVDNVVAYVGMGRYHFSAINRAADSDNDDPSDDFVLQMGGFLGFPPIPGQFAQFTTPVEKFDPIVVDANGDGQVDFNADTNSRGTVSLALAAGDPNSGTSSFFINLGANDFLDDQGFVPFAQIEDMTTVDSIMALMQEDISEAVGESGNLAFIDVPVQENGRMVVVNGVRVVAADDGFSFVGPIASALQLRSRASSAAVTTAASTVASFPAPVTQSLADSATATSGSALINPLTIQASTVPEPSGLMLAMLAVLAGCSPRLRQFRR